MKPSQASAEIARVAERYRERGYGVEIDTPLPSELGLPPTIRADLIAFGTDERVVVEVKRRVDLERDPKTRVLAAAVEQHPGWRFELVLLPEPAVDLPPMDQDVIELDLRSALDQLDHARALARNGELEAGLLLAVAAGEAILRKATAHRGQTREFSGGPALVKTAFSAGTISQTQSQQLEHLYRLRNAVAHGFEPPTPVTVDDVERVTSLLRSLARAAQERTGG